MDESKERKKSVKSRRRSLRILQPEVMTTNQRDSISENLESQGQPMYGSIWIEKSESPIPVRKPRRSMSSVKMSHHFARNQNDNGYRPEGKENFSPDLSRLKSFKDRSPEIRAKSPKSPEIRAKSPKSPPYNCPVEERLWNQENSYEEIGVPRLGHKGEDRTVEESLVGNISILSLDEMDAICRDLKPDPYIWDEWQISSDPLLENDEDRISLETNTLPLDQSMSESPVDPATFIKKEICQSPLAHPFYSADGGLNPSDNIIYECSPSESAVEDDDARIYSDGFPGFSTSKTSAKHDENSPPFSTYLCRRFQQLDIVRNSVVAGDFEAGIAKDDSGTDYLHENAASPSFSSEEMSNASLVDNSALDQASSLASDSWCYVKCYSDEESSGVSSPVEVSLSDGCDLWESELSSAGSELSDSWCFSGHLNPTAHFNSTPDKTLGSMLHQVHKGLGLESDKHQDFSTDDECEMITIDNMSPGCVTFGPSVGVEEQRLPAIEHLRLENCSLSSSKKPFGLTQKKPETKKPSCSKNKRIKEEFGKAMPPQKIAPPKKSTSNISELNPKTEKPPSWKRGFQSKTDGRGEKYSLSQTSTLTKKSSTTNPRVTKLHTSAGSKEQKVLSPEIASHTLANVSTCADPKKNPATKWQSGSGFQKLRKDRSGNLGRELRAHLKSSSSPDVVVIDSMDTGAQAKLMASLEGNGNQKSAESLFSEMQEATLVNSLEAPSQDNEFNHLGSQLYHQADTKLVAPPNKVATPDKPISDSSLKKKQTRESDSFILNQVPSLTSATDKTKRSLDSITTSYVTVRRRNTKPVEPKSVSSVCDTEGPTDFVLVKNKTRKSISCKRKKLRRQALAIPVEEENDDDIMIVDLESLTSTSSVDDLTNSENPFEGEASQTETRSTGSTNFTPISSLVNEDEPTTVLQHADSVRNRNVSDECEEETESNSVSLNSDDVNRVVGMVTDDVSNQSEGSCPFNNTSTEKSPSSSPLSETTKILNERVQTEPSQPTFRRSTRRSSIELSLSYKKNPKPNSTDVKGVEKTAQTSGKTLNSFEMNVNQNDKELEEIYKKKPYVPFSPTRLETIYSPSKKRNQCNFFSKRKYVRKISFQPSDTQLKNRRKKAMRNWPFLFEVPNIDEKLNELLKNT